jgi:predicted DNA-binding transcriptional regulator AlpA
VRRFLTQTAEALLISDVAAAALASISRAHLHRLRAAGKWGPKAVRLGRKVLYRRADVISWIDSDCPDAQTWAAMTAARQRRAM